MKLLICTQAVDADHPILGFFIGWIEEFAKHFEEVHVICLQKGRYDLPQHVHVYSLGKEEGESRIKYLFRFYRYFSRVFLTVRVDYVFFHMGAVYNILAAPFFMLRRFYGTKFYWWKAHGTISLMSRTALFFVDGIYTASAESFPIATKKRHVVGHGIETNVAIVSPSPESHPVILFVGRITPRKNLACFVLTIYELRNRGLHVRGRIIGAMPDEAYIHNIRELITELGLSEIVSLEGPREHRALEEEYKHAAIMINSSETGSIDKVVLEAMAHGLPCVASASAYGELLGRFGLATAQQNPKLYADAVEHVLRMDEGTRMELAKMLRGEVVAHHSLSTLTNRIFSL